LKYRKLKISCNAEGLVDLSWAQDFLLFGNCVIFELFQDVCMPVMDGLQATRLIRSFEETGNWDAAVKAGIDQAVLSLDSLQNGLGSTPSAKRIPIIAVSTSNLICLQYIYIYKLNYMVCILAEVSQ
jgi:CheY-like chemotaxis protein